MLNKREIGLLHKFVKKELGEDADLFDTEAHIDNTLTYWEAKNELKEKLKDFREDLEEQMNSLTHGNYEEESKEFFNVWSENNPFGVKDLVELFRRPQIVGIIADANSGKSNFLYYLITELKKEYDFNFYSFGLKKDIGDKKIYSVKELEQIKNSFIIVDEFFTLLDLDNRKQKKLIERTLRLIYHNNNILLLCGLPENYKKFLANKLNIVMFGKCTIGDFINGSSTKYTCLDYKGIELGSSVLELPPSKFVVYDGKHYNKMNVPYLEEFDTKKDNTDILKKKDK